MSGRKVSLMFHVPLRVYQGSTLEFSEKSEKSVELSLSFGCLQQLLILKF